MGEKTRKKLARRKCRSGRLRCKCRGATRECRYCGEAICKLNPRHWCHS